MSAYSKYAFDVKTSIYEIIYTVCKDLKLEIKNKIELNEAVLSELKKLEIEGFYNSTPIDVYINDFDNAEDIENALNETLHVIYSQCELQKNIMNSRKVDQLINKLIEKESECEDIKKEILKYSF